MAWRKGKSANPRRQWKPGQSGNPRGRPQAAERALVRDFIARCHVRQVDPASIARELAKQGFVRAPGVPYSPRWVRRQIRRIRAEWEKSVQEERSTELAAALERHFEVMRVAWAAFDRTIGKHQVITREGNEDLDPAGKKRATRKKVSVRERELAGSPEWLRIILDANKKVADLLGLEPPTKMELMGKDGGPIAASHEHGFDYEQFARAFAAFARGLSDPGGMGAARADGDPQSLHPGCPEAGGLPVAEAGAVSHGTEP